jgi:hypothetical protein
MGTLINFDSESCINNQTVWIIDYGKVSRVKELQTINQKTLKALNFLNL